MADREFGFSIKVLGTDEQVSQLGKVEAQMKQLAMERSSLNKSVKEGTISEQEYGQQLADINLKTKSLRQSKGQLERAIEVENELLESQGGSYNQLSSELNNLRQQYRNLSEEERESAEGKEMVEKIGELDAELKDIDASMGQYQRNVGNYSSVWDEVSGSLQKTSPQLGVIKGGVEKLSDVLGKVRDMMFGNITAQQGLTASTQAATTATTGLSKALRVLKVALLSTGVGAIVVAFGSLVAALASTQRGMDKVNSVLRPITALFSRLWGIIQDHGLKVLDRLEDGFKNPQQAMQDLGDTIRDAILTRIEAFAVAGRAIVKILKGDLKEGFTELGDAVIQGTTGIEDASEKMANFGKDAKEFIDQSIEAGNRLHDLQVRIEEQENRMATRREELNALYQEQRLLAQDQTKTEEERIAAYRKAEEAQRELLKEEQALIDLKIEKKELENSLNDTSRTDEKELQDLIGQRIQKEAQASQRISRVRSTLSGLIKQQRAEEAAVVEANSQRIQELSQELMMVEINNAESTYERKKAILAKEKDDRIASLREQMGESRAMDEQLKALIEAAEEEHLEKLAELRLEYGEKEIEDLQQVTDKKVSMYDLQAKMAELKVKERLANEVISEEQAAAEILAIREDAIQQQLNAVRNQQAEMLEMREALVEELAAAETEAQRKAIEEQLELLDGQNEEIKVKAQELQTELAETAKEQRESEDTSWLGEAFGVSEEEADKIKGELMNLAQTLYQGLMDYKQQQIEESLNKELQTIEKHNEEAVRSTEKRHKKERQALDRKLREGEINQKEYTKRIKSLDEKLDKEQARLQADREEREEAARKRAFEDHKRLQKAQALISAALAIVQAFAQLGPIAGAVAAVGIGISTGLQISKIENQQFALGGEIKGKSHEQGGVIIEAEGGEGIINKRSMASQDRLTVSGTPYEIASAINSYKGYGQPFDQAVRYAALGGPVAAPTAPRDTGTSTVMNRGMTRAEMDYLSDRIVSGINDKRVILATEDLDEYTDESQKVKTKREW